MLPVRRLTPRNISIPPAFLFLVSRKTQGDGKWPGEGDRDVAEQSGKFNLSFRVNGAVQQNGESQENDKQASPAKSVKRKARSRGESQRVLVMAVALIQYRTPSPPAA